jgi:cysteine desulfurase / selenocysteine lyase
MKPGIQAPPAPSRPAVAGLDAASLRGEFPILTRRIDGRALVYLDNAATSQKPRAVIDAVRSYYETENANIHRGVHTLSQEATRDYENAREKVRAFIGAADTREVIFTRGTTEAINLVAQSFGRAQFQPGDEIVISTMEHHSNIVPWQMLSEESGALLRIIPVNDAGELELDEYARMLGPRTRLVAVAHVSNALGTVNPVEEIVRIAHERDIPVLLDGAQAVPHMPVDVQKIGCEFYAFSAHKMYGPTGIGALYGRRELLEAMRPYQGGGDMISSVTFEKTTYNDLPHKFEAGTPHIAGAIGLGAAIDFMQGVGVERIAAHEADLLAYGTERLNEIPGLRMIGTARHKAGVLSFVIGGIHPHDIGTIVDREGVALRTGHHCAQPTMERFGVPATARASFALYNTREEIDALVKGIDRVLEVFGDKR